jgi:osmotically-inducible protein OsmY
VATIPRSDAEIFADARSALDQHPTIPPGVHVHVQGGTVRLTGSVRFERERAEAEEAVRHIEGTQGITNNIAVTQPVDPEGVEAPRKTR